MSELTARLEIYGSIDRSVVDERLSVDEVADYLAPYGVGPTESAPPATGWYSALSDVLSDIPGSTLVRPDAANPAAAVAEMAELPLTNPIDAEHRLRTLFLTRRLLPDVDTSPDSAFVTALQAVVEYRPEQDVVPDPRDATLRLSEMLVDRNQFPGRTGYVDLAAAAQSGGLISVTTASLAAVTCEEGTAWFRPAGSSDDSVAAVVTSRVVVSATACSVHDLRLKFHPGRWPTCLPSFWGAMDPLAPPPPHAPSPSVDPGTARFVYREHVGDQVNKSQWFSPVLEFWYDPLQTGPATNRVVNGFALHYGLAGTLPAGSAQDPSIVVDDGELTVRRSNVTSASMTVTATTYKMLAMRPPLPSAGVAIFACASGWADHAKALVSGCLLNP